MARRLVCWNCNLLRVIMFCSNFQEEKRLRTDLRRKMELEKMSSLKPLMEKLEDGHLPFICLQYNDSAGVNHLVPGVYLGNVDSMGSSKLRNMVTFPHLCFFMYSILFTGNWYTFSEWFCGFYHSSRVNSQYLPGALFILHL